MKYTNWKISAVSPTAGAISRYRDSALLGAVLSSRGIKTADEAEALLCCNPDGLHDPFLMKDMDKAVSRIRQAIERGEQVAVYGDYDVDGITAACLMTGFLRQNGSEPQIYIPNRLDEGYGLSETAIEDLAEMGVSLIITVDCGVTAVREVAFAASLGVDIIISDHHECQEELPSAAAVIDPKRQDCPYPYKALAGVGVAFKLVCALERELGLPAILQRYGDLVAVGTVADIMPVTGENRALVRAGLTALRAGGRPGFSCLMDAAGLDRETIEAENISYAIAPRLNAAGRMGQAEAALALLLATDFREGARQADHLEALNLARRQLESEMTKKSLAELSEEGYQSGPVIIASEGWHIGVAGIVAARLLERHQEPVIVICLEGGEGKGSCRSAPGFNMFEALEYCKEYLTRFGGHAFAAGLTIGGERLAGFKARFREYYDANPPARDGFCLEIDFSVENANYLSPKNVEALSELAPFGNGNPYPLLALEGALLREATPIGGGKHMKLQVEKWGRTFSCVYFGMAKGDFSTRPGQQLDLAFSPKINDFMGRRTVQLVVRDMRPAGWLAAEPGLEICGRFYSGVQITPQEAVEIYPNREDFVGLWRYLEKRAGKQPMSGGTERLLMSFAAGLWGNSPAKYYICLKVWEELGLVTLSEDTGALTVAIVQGAKVDLGGSAVLQRLKALRIQEERGEELE